MMLLIGSGRIAAAGDFCLAVDDVSSDLSDTLVGKGFSMPSKGACLTFRGFFTDRGKNPFVHGLACGSSDNTLVSFVLNGISSSFKVFLHRDTLAGGLTEFPYFSGSSSLTAVVQKVPCDPGNVPVPAL